MSAQLMDLVRFSPYDSKRVAYELEAWGVWGVKRARPQLTLAIFSPAEAFIRHLAARNPLQGGRPRKVYEYDTAAHGKKWACGFGNLQLAYLAARAYRYACRAHQQLYSQIVTLRALNHRIQHYGSARSQRRRQALQAERGCVTEEIIRLVPRAREDCPVRQQARQQERHSGETSRARPQPARAGFSHGGQAGYARGDPLLEPHPSQKVWLGPARQNPSQNAASEKPRTLSSDKNSDASVLAHANSKRLRGIGSG
jgi:hypothetical protein